MGVFAFRPLFSKKFEAILTPPFFSSADESLPIHTKISLPTSRMKTSEVSSMSLLSLPSTASMGVIFNSPDESLTRLNLMPAEPALSAASSSSPGLVTSVSPPRASQNSALWGSCCLDRCKSNGSMIVFFHLCDEVRGCGFLSYLVDDSNVCTSTAFIILDPGQQLQSLCLFWSISLRTIPDEELQGRIWTRIRTSHGRKKRESSRLHISNTLPSGVFLPSTPAQLGKT